jgi:hypothetical protein
MASLYKSVSKNINQKIILMMLLQILYYMLRVNLYFYSKIWYLLCKIKPLLSSKGSGKFYKGLLLYNNYT